MSLTQSAFAILTVLALSLGQILFKVASGSIVFGWPGLLNSLLNPKLLLALGVYAVATVMWLYVLKTTSLTLAYPFAALAFFVVPILSHFLLGEPLRLNTFLGAGVIAVGVGISVLR